MYHQCGAELRNDVSASSMECTIIMGQNIKTTSVPAAERATNVGQNLKADVPPVWGRTSKRHQCHQGGMYHQ